MYNNAVPILSARSPVPHFVCNRMNREQGGVYLPQRVLCLKQPESSARSNLWPFFSHCLADALCHISVLLFWL